MISLVEVFAAFAWASLVTFAGSMIFALGWMVKSFVSGKVKT